MRIRISALRHRSGFDGNRDDDGLGFRLGDGREIVVADEAQPVEDRHGVEQHPPYGTHRDGARELVLDAYGGLEELAVAEVSGYDEELEVEREPLFDHAG